MASAIDVGAHRPRLDAEVLVQHRVEMERARRRHVEAASMRTVRHTENPLEALARRVGDTVRRSRRPVPTSPSEMLRRGAPPSALLSYGYTFVDLVCDGVTMAQLLDAPYTLDDMRHLGATYEWMVRAGAGAAIARRRLHCGDFMSAFDVSLAQLLDDRVIDSIATVVYLRPSPQRLRELGAVVDVLVRHGLSTVHVREFAFTFEQWRDVLELRGEHLVEDGALHFCIDKDCAELGWDRVAVEQLIDAHRARRRRRDM